MYTRSRRSFSVLSLTLVMLLVACGPADSSPGTPPPDGSSVAPSAAVSGDASAPASSAAGGTQTDTDWGRIWDDVPVGFPMFPGSTVADDVSPDPVSATYKVANDDTAEIAVWMQSSLETAAFGTEAMSGPLEDGSFVLESVGGGDCRIQTSVEPMGGLTFVIVRYGAGCPPG